MFNFMKKGGGSSANAAEREKMDRSEEKERRKREKKLRKEAKNFIASTGAVSGSMSTEELLRLDEVRKSLKIRGRRKEKEKLPSGITADYSAEFFAALDIDRATLASGDESVCGSSTAASSELDRGNDEIMATVNTTIDLRAPQRSLGASNNSLATNLKYRSLPQVPPKPPKRGILKGSRSNIANIHEELIITTPDQQLLLMRNTMQNELLYESGAGSSVGTMGSVGSSISPRGTSFTSVDSLRSDDGRAPAPQSPLSNLHILTSPSPSAESLTDTTNSSFATPLFSLSPVGESQGSDRWSRVHAFEDVYLPLPPIQLAQLPPPRVLIIRRQKSPRHDFGFSLRKAICLDRSESLLAPTLRPVIFAEPGAGGGATGLLPGDRLLKVNDTEVSELSREVIIEMIRNSGDTVTVEVQPVFELVELSRRCMSLGGASDESGDEVDRSIKVNCSTLKRSASKRFKRLSHNDVEHYDSNIPTSSNDDFVWLVHRGGFCAAVRLSQHKAHLESHKTVVQLLHNGEKLTVDEDDVEKQNPSSMNQVEDICELKHLNESSVLHCVRQRFGSNLIHTKAGPVLMVVNPMAPLSLYSEKVVSMFRGCKTEDMPPHIYSLAQTAYRTLLETRRDQSLIFMGRSGSGKTTSFKHALYFLALAAGSYNNLFNAEKVSAVNTILEAFGNTKTCLNANATRFTQIFSLDFDQTGQIASASVQVLLPERQRAGKRHAANEHSFHIITRLVAGAEGLLQKELHLDNISSEDNHPFVSLPQKLEERHRAAADFMRTTKAFETLNIEPKAVRGILNILASIYHLGIAGVTKSAAGPNARVQFTNPSAARKAAGLLGVSLEDLLAAILNSNSSTATNNISPSKSNPMDSLDSAWDSLEALVVGLYAEALAAVVALINKAICTSAHTIASILLVDTPGFQNPASCGGAQVGATLCDLRHNYLQERLQMLYHHNTLVAPRDRYAQELIEIDMEGMSESHPGPMVSLIDRAPQNHVVRTSQRDLRDQDRRGLIWLLDEESMYPNSNDDTFLERLFSHYGDREHQSLLRKCTGPKQFVLHHLQGTNPVLYTAEGWVRNSREHSGIRNAATLLQDSTKDEISRLYMGNLARGTGGIVFCGSLAGLDGTQSLRRVSSIRRSFTSAGIKRNSVLLQMKLTVDGIIDTLRRTGTHFVHCFLLQHNAGQHSTTPGGGCGASPNPISSLNMSSNGDIINIPLLRSQLRGSQILESARLHRMGFPESVPLTEFVRRFSLLAGDAVASKDTTVEDILTANEVDTATYRVGPSQIFFRSGVLCELEAKRDVLLSDRIIQFQACCRGYLARKQIARRRVQELAVRCIQRNVKSFLAVRDWPWWRLLVRVTPLLNVHRTEEQLKVANDELLTLRNKLEKIENERNLLKSDNQKLEAKPKQHATPLTTSPAAPSAVNNPSSKINNNSNQDTPTLEGSEADPNSTKFLNRVLLAMMNSKSAKFPTSTSKPPSSSGASCYTNGASEYLLNKALNGSSSSISSTQSQPLPPRPPVPPQAQMRLRKQTKPIATTTPTRNKERSHSPIVEIISAHRGTSKSSKFASSHKSSDSTADGLFSKSTFNGFTLIEDGSTTDKALSDQSTAPFPIKVSLNLPFYKSETMSAAKSERYRPRSIANTATARSPSPALSLRSGTSSRCSSNFSTTTTSHSSSASHYSSASAALQTTPPRRVFPQTYTRGNSSFDLYESRHLESAPVVFDANLSFVLGCKKQPVRQGFRPSPSHQEAQTSSAYLSEKIQNFLRRTDHVQEEWSALSKRPRSSASGCSTPTNSMYDDYDTISLIERQRERASMERCPSIGRSRSAQNILTKAYQLSKTLPRTPTSRSNSMARDYPERDDDDRTIHEEDDNDSDELSEMTIDFTEERSSANINAERLEAETAERLKLEKELTDQQNKVKNLQETTEKLEMELICAKSDLNGVSEDEDHDNDESVGGVYKLKYERVARELEFTKRRLQTQHEHDLEQLVGLKKQLEKKLSDAYEEVEEQRQVVGQWKRKTQKMTNEMNDLRMLLEEQNVRNNMLEKKQRKFDSECQALQDAARQERQAKDRLSREMDVLIAEKFGLEQSLADTRLDLELKEEKLASLQRELEEMTFGVGTEEEIAQLRRNKNELDRRVKEQDEELDEMAGQVQLLEQAKLRLEMALETMRKEARREAQQRDEELEEARGVAYKKIKALECQLETEHEERTLLLREKHELERRLAAIEDQERTDRQVEEAANQKLRRDVRKYKALLKDCQAQLERLKADTPGKTLVRQLRNQLEDAESARTLAMKARQAADAELAEVQAMFEEANRGRNDAEDRAIAAQRDRTELQAQIEENEEELAELMKKYSSTVKQLNTEQIAASEYEFKLSELEAERNNLKDQVSELQQRLENIENLADPSAAMMSKRLELRSKELESRLELEQATRTRLEVQVTRHKESVEKLQQELTQAKLREKQAQDVHKKSQKTLRELREEFHVVTGREQESILRRKDLEKKLEQTETDATSLKNDLRLALQRIADLQQAMEEEVDDDDAVSESEESNDSDVGSLVDLEERLRPIQVKRSTASSLGASNSAQAGNGTKLLIREKDENSPRITLTSPSSPQINKLAAAAKASGDKQQAKHSNSGTLNGDTSFA